MKKTVLVLGGLLNEEIETLEQKFNVIRLSRGNDPETVLEQYQKDIVAIISTPLKGVSKALINALPNIEIISQFGIGVDNIPVSYAKRRGIAVTNTPDLVTDDTADIGMALMLAVMRRIVEGDMYVRVGKWETGSMGLGVSLSGKTVGILGLGRIGQAVAHRAAAFNMSVIYHSRRKKEVPYKFIPDVQSLAEQADILMITCAGGSDTANLVNASVLEKLGPSGYLVNIARGSVVNQEDLLIALRNKTIAGAGMDVFWNEPHVPEALVSMDNVVLLPHVGSASKETRHKMGQLVIENITAHFEGRPLTTPVAA